MPSPHPRVANLPAEIPPPAPSINSAKRLQALDRTRLLDTPPEQAFDRLTRLACRILHVPVALLSLLDSDREFLKSSHGLKGPFATQRTIPFSHSFCRHVVTLQAPLVIRDACEDPLVSNNPAVVDLNVAAYLGIPLMTADGHTLGSLSVIDHIPHVWSEEEIVNLTELAALAMATITMYQQLGEQRTDEKEWHQRVATNKGKQAEAALPISNMLLQGVIDAISDGIYVRDLAGYYLFVNQVGAEIVGLTPQQMVGQKYTTLFPAETVAQIREEDRLTLATGQVQKMEVEWSQQGVKKVFHSTRTAYRDAQGNRLGLLSVMHDISERKPVEEALRVSEANFRALFESMTQGVVYQNRAGKITAANAAAERILGLRLDEMQGRSSADGRWRASQADGTNFSVEDHPAMVALRTGQVQHNILMYVFNPHANEQRCLQVDAVPQFRQGEALPYQVYTLFSDITEQRRATEVLAYHAQLLDNIHDAVVAADTHFRITAWNLGAERMYGWQASEVMGLATREVIRSELSDELRQTAIQALNENGRYRMELVTHHKDGTAIPIEAVAVALRGIEGQIIGYLSINRDMTERKQAEATLLESEERFRATFEQAAVGVAHGDLTGAYIRVNNCLCEILGYSRAELLQKNFQMLTHPDDVAENQAHFQQLLAGACDSYSIEKRYVRKDKSSIWVNVTVSLVYKLQTSTPDYSISVVEDISERKSHEYQLQELNETLEQRVAKRTTQLQTSNAKLQESQANFRQLSRQLMQLIEQERTRISREIHDQLGQSLTAIKIEMKAAQRRLDVSQTLVVERLQSAGTLIDETIQIVRRIAADLRPDMLDHFGLGATVEWQMQQFKTHSDLSYQLEANLDETKLTPDMAIAAFRILQEALTNITRHAQARTVNVSLKMTTAEFLLAVRDDGQGITKPEQPRPSLGVLGMRERAQQLGGSVEMLSPPGEGTTLLLRLPLQNKELG